MMLKIILQINLKNIEKYLTFQKYSYTFVVC